VVSRRKRVSRIRYNPTPEVELWGQILSVGPFWHFMQVRVTERSTGEQMFYYQRLHRLRFLAKLEQRRLLAQAKTITEEHHP